MMRRLALSHTILPIYILSASCKLGFVFLHLHFKIPRRSGAGAWGAGFRSAVIARGVAHLAREEMFCLLGWARRLQRRPSQNIRLGGSGCGLGIRTSGGPGETPPEREAPFIVRAIYHTYIYWAASSSWVPSVITGEARWAHRHNTIWYKQYFIV
jgi:hypothetical protein